MASEVILLDHLAKHSSPLIKAVTLDGLGVDDNANGDYSITPQTFSLIPPDGTSYILTRVLIYIEDTGSFDTLNYGNGIVMANGYHSWYRQNGVDYDIVDEPNSVKTTADLSSIMYDTQLNTYGLGNEFLVGRFTFSKIGKNIQLDGKDGDAFHIRFRDDLSGLVRHKFTLEGYQVSTNLIKR